MTKGDAVKIAFAFLSLVCVLSVYHNSFASDARCVGNVEKDTSCVCEVTKIEGNRILVQEKLEISIGCWYTVKETGNAKIGDLVKILEFDLNDNDCYGKKPCGRVVKVGGPTKGSVGAYNIKAYVTRRQNNAESVPASFVVPQGYEATIISYFWQDGNPGVGSGSAT